MSTLSTKATIGSTSSMLGAEFKPPLAGVSDPWGMALRCGLPGEIAVDTEGNVYVIDGDGLG